MNFILSVSLNPKGPEGKGHIGIQFEGDNEMPFYAILAGIKEFLAAAEKNQSVATKPCTLGQLFPEEGV